MKKYDPNQAPNPEEWNKIDESERIEMIRRWHRKAKIKLPNANLHAGIHTGVENQIALGDELPVAATLDRLMTEGVDRHEAIHCIGEALACHMYNLQVGTVGEGDPNEAYYKELATLSIEQWRKRYE